MYNLLKIKNAFFFGLFMLVLGCASQQENKDLAYNHFKVGVSLLNQGQREKGLEQLLIAKDLDPNNELILNHLGLAYFYLNEFELAILSFKSSIDKKPNYSEAQNNLGRTYIEVKDFASARKHLSLAASDLTYASKDKVWLNLGLSYFYDNQIEKSQNFFLKSISANRNNCLAYNYFGRTQVELENFEKAARAMDQAIYHCRARGFDEPHYYSAIALFRLGKKPQALARLQEGLKLFPNGPHRGKIEEMMNLMKLTETK